MRNDDWIDESEYPDESDIEAFGDDAPGDYDPLTIGYVDDVNFHFWTKRRIIIGLIALILMGVLLLPVLDQLL